MCVLTLTCDCHMIVSMYLCLSLLILNEAANDLMSLSHINTALCTSSMYDNVLNCIAE